MLVGAVHVGLVLFSDHWGYASRVQKYQTVAQTNQPIADISGCNFLTFYRHVRKVVLSDLCQWHVSVSSNCQMSILCFVLKAFASSCCWLGGRKDIRPVKPEWWGKGKGKGFPYSTPSVGPGADPGVQAVSPQRTINHPPSGRLPLLSARPAVTSPAAEHHRPLAGTKLYCLVTEAHRCEQLA